MMRHHPSLDLNPVIFTKMVFVTVANSFSVISQLFSFSISLSELKLLLLKNALMVFQSFFLLDKSLTFCF